MDSEELENNNVLPDFKSVKKLKENAVQRHTLEEALIDWYEAESTQEALEWAEESVQYAKDKSLYNSITKQLDSH